MGALRALVLCGVAACYRPGLDSSCLLRCDDVGGEAACPNGLSCNNGFCGRGSDVCNGDGGVVPDAPSDGRDPDGMLGELCVGTAPIQPCFTPPPSGTLDLTGFSTDTCSDVQVLGGRQTCVVAAAFVQVSGNQRFTGSRPLVIVGTQQIVIGAGATIDVSSSRTLNPPHGAGAPGACGNAEQGMGATGGSAGGTFVGQGGSGGNGDGGGIGGSPAPLASVGFGGGCDGAPSPNNQAPGPGGGAVYLISETMIVVSGDIAAGGGGGRGGQASEGGAGGGSGGFIVLDSPMVGFGAGVELVASGGGGGGGGCMGDPGLAGQDATILVASPRGGDGGATAGDGGAGATSLTSANDANGATDPGCAGGGGGGSVGRIRFMRGGTCGGRCTPLAD